MRSVIVAWFVSWVVIPMATAQSFQTEIEDEEDLKIVVACHILTHHFEKENAAIWWDNVMVRTYGVEITDKIVKGFEPLVKHNIKTQPAEETDMALAFCEAAYDHFCAKEKNCQGTF